MSKTYRPKKDDISRRKILLDAEGQILGRLCVEVASILRGKNKPDFTPGVNSGDMVYIVNSDKICVTGKKLVQKIFYKHTGYIGNMKKTMLKDRMAKDSTEVIRTAVKRMLPKNPLGRAQIKLLHVFKDNTINVGTQAKNLPKDFIKMDLAEIKKVNVFTDSSKSANKEI